MSLKKNVKLSFRIDEATADKMRAAAELEDKTPSEYIVESIVSHLEEDAPVPDYSPEKVMALIDIINQMKKKHPKIDFHELEKGVRKLWQYSI